NVDMMAQDAIGWTPIHIKTIINEALIIANEQGRDQLSYKDWLAAADMRFLGLKQPISKMSEDDKRAVAYHEAGHAVVTRYLKPEDRMQKASIVRRGETLGVVSRSEREERHQLHARQIEADIMISLGSRAVEELMLGTKMLQELYEETKRLIREKEYAVHAVAAALIERQELIGSELDEVFAFADEAHPEKAAPFIRMPLVLPTMDELLKQGNGNGHVPMFATTGGVPVPGQPGPDQPGPGQPGPGPVPP